MPNSSVGQHFHLPPFCCCCTCRSSCCPLCPVPDSIQVGFAILSPIPAHLDVVSIFLLGNLILLPLLIHFLLPFLPCQELVVHPCSPPAISAWFPAHWVGPFSRLVPRSLKSNTPQQLKIPLGLVSSLNCYLWLLRYYLAMTGSNRPWLAFLWRFLFQIILFEAVVSLDNQGSSLVTFCLFNAISQSLFIT